VEGGGVPGEQRDPVALMLGDVAQLFADQVRAVQVMLLDQQLVEAGAFLRFDQAHGDPVEQGLLGGRQERGFSSCHGAESKKVRGSCSAKVRIPASFNHFPPLEICPRVNTS
jgi:hypothetical protein